MLDCPTASCSCGKLAIVSWPWQVGPFHVYYSGPCLLPQCLYDWPVPTCSSRSESPTGLLFTTTFCGKSPIWTWEHLLCRCSCTQCQLLVCAIQDTLLLPASYTLHVYMPLSQVLTLKTACTSHKYSTIATFHGPSNLLTPINNPGCFIFRVSEISSSPINPPWHHLAKGDTLWIVRIYVFVYFYSNTLVNQFATYSPIIELLNVHFRNGRWFSQVSL